MIDAAPEVRVIVVNYNGGEMTLTCLRAIEATDWPRHALHIVLVDNGSSDGVADRTTRELDGVQMIRSETNLGFAGGANLGLRGLPPTTSYVALINNDVSVPPSWLQPLVATLESDPTCGAACPKILLTGAYEAIEIVGDPVRLGLFDRRTVSVRVTGVCVDGDDVLRRARFADGFFGPEYLPGDPEPFQWAAPQATLLVPTPSIRAERKLQLSAPRSAKVQLRSGGAEVTAVVGPTPSWVALPPTQETFDVINNVGTELQPDGYARDRGYLEHDRGQFDEPADVDAWCGATVLLPTSYVHAVGTFDRHLFAYYEDVELSLRGRGRWRYVTVPGSVVRHVHMATSSASARRALYFNERNRLLILSRYRPKRYVARQVMRYAGITISYVRRDVLGRVALRQRPSWTVSGARLRALLDCLLIWSRLAPGRRWNPKPS